MYGFCGFPIGDAKVQQNQIEMCGRMPTLTRTWMDCPGYPLIAIGIRDMHGYGLIFSIENPGNLRKNPDLGSGGVWGAIFIVNCFKRLKD